MEFDANQNLQNKCLRLPEKVEYNVLNKILLVDKILEYWMSLKLWAQQYRNIQPQIHLAQLLLQQGLCSELLGLFLTAWPPHHPTMTVSFFTTQPSICQIVQHFNETWTVNNRIKLFNTNKLWTATLDSNNENNRNVYHGMTHYIT